MTAKSILSKLVSFPVLGGDSNLDIIAWIKAYINDLGIETQLVYNTEKTKASLHCRIGPPTDDGVILFIGDEDSADGEDELLINLYTGDELEVQYDSGGFGSRYASTFDNLDFTTDWTHLAITYDGSDDMDVFINGKLEVIDETMQISSNVDGSTPSVYIAGHPAGTPPFSGMVDFNGAMDEVRFLNYEKQAFAGGIMISKVEPGTNTITLYNAGDAAYEINGLEIWKDGSRC